MAIIDIHMHGATKQELEELKAQVAGLTHLITIKFQKMSTRVEEIAANLDEANGKLTAIGGSLTGITGDINSLNAIIQDLRIKVQNGAGVTNADMDLLAAKSASVKDGLVQIATVAAGLDAQTPESPVVVSPVVVSPVI